MDGRKGRGDRTRAALLAAARKLFAQHGYNGTHIREIGEVAGANPALVRYHFNCKRDLWHTVHETRTGDDAHKVTDARLMLYAALESSSLTTKFTVEQLVQAVRDAASED